jgi:hypothetical protein
MDGMRFDNFARRLSRRKAIGAVGATGLVAAASRVLPAAAQDGVTCQMSMQALTSAGPSVNTAYAGVLEITLAGDGSIDTGSLAFTGGPTVPVVGQFAGPFKPTPDVPSTDHCQSGTTCINGICCDPDGSFCSGSGADCSTTRTCPVSDEICFDGHQCWVACYPPV